VVIDQRLILSSAPGARNQLLALQREEVRLLHRAHINLWVLRGNASQRRCPDFAAPTMKVGHRHGLMREVSTDQPFQLRNVAKPPSDVDAPQRSRASPRCGSGVESRLRSLLGNRGLRAVFTGVCGPQERVDEPV